MTPCITIDRVMTLTEAIMFSPIKLMIGDNDITLRCQFSWSSDRVNWSCWADYNNYAKTCRAFNTDYYLRILFREAQVPTLYINNITSTCFSVSVLMDNPFLSDPCSIIEASGFDLYCGWDCALQMIQQLSDSVVCMAGIPIYYFRVIPDSDTKSYTFKEYVLHNVESVKQIKMIFPDGSMPSSKPTISEWDMEFEVDWEVELSKTQFATAFGEDAFPKQRDFVWVPMQKRMYMVNTAYEEKNENLMWRANTWKLALVKWQDQSNVDQGDFTNLIDTLIVNKYEDVFETGERREGELTGTFQIAEPPHAATNLYSIENSDYIRKQISIDTMRIESGQLNHGNIIVAKSRYIFYKESEITYQNNWCGDNGTLSLIFDCPIRKDFDSNDHPIVRIGDYIITYSDKDKDNGYIKFSDKEISIEKGNTYILLLRWGRSVGEISMHIYKYTWPTDIPSYKVRQAMYKFDFENPACERTVLDERLISHTGIPVVLYGYPLNIWNLKLYNKYINDEQRDEILKYATKDKFCIINDQARPINNEHGYNVR